MKRPFVWMSAGYLSGILLQQAFAFPAPGVAAAAAAMIPFLWLMRGRRFFLPVFLAVLCLLGCLSADFDDRRAARAVENFALGRKISLQGYVITPPEIKTQGKKVNVSFALRSENLLRRTDSGRELIETAGDVQVFLFNPETLPSLGDHVRLWGELKRPHRVKNPGEFDYGAFLARQDIRALFQAYGGRSIRILSSGRLSPVRRTVEQARGFLEGRIERLFDPPHAALLKALILGKRKGLDPDLRDRFMKTGTSHLLAISGLHVGLVAGTFYLVMLLAGLGQRAGALASLAATAAYVLIAGAHVPVIRAGWMAGIGFLSLVFEREKNSLNTFFFALFLFLVADPGVLKQVSFQLSFLSVFSLVLMLRSFHENWKWSETLARTGAVMLGTLPVVLYHFQIFSPVSFAANLGAIPLFHLALMGALFSLAAGGIPWFGQMVCLAVEKTLGLALGWIEACSRWDWGYFYIPEPSGGKILAYYALLGLFLLTRTLPKKRWLVYARASLISGWAALAVWMLAPGREAGFSMTWLAAGNNEIAHVRFASGHDLLINAGRRYPSDQGRWIVHPYLKSRGIKHLAAIVLTDSYKRHSGGLPTVLTNHRADFIFGAGAQNPAAASRRSPPYRRVRMKEVLEIGAGEKIRVLDVVQGKMILEIETGGVRILSLPDLSLEIMQALTVYRQEIGAAAVLMLSSGMTSDEKALNALFDLADPDFVVAPSASEGLAAALAERDIGLLETRFLGAVTMRHEESRDSLAFESVLEGPVGTVRLN